MFDLDVERPSPCLQKLHALPWQVACVGESHGVRVGMRSNDARFLAAVQAGLLPPLRSVAVAGRQIVHGLYSLIYGDESARPRRLHLVYEGHRLVCRTRHFEEAVWAVEHDVHDVLAQQADQVFVHAGAVAWQGRAIVLPGRSQTGKTTLVAALLRAGAHYLSDEYAVFDAAGRVHGFGCALRVRADGGTRTRVLAPSLGGPLPLGAVVSTAYGEDAMRWEAGPLQRRGAAVTLLANCMSVRQQPQRTMAAVARALRGARWAHGLRGDADAAAGAILQWSEG